MLVGPLTNVCCRKFCSCCRILCSTHDNQKLLLPKSLNLNNNDGNFTLHVKNVNGIIYEIFEASHERMVS
jgi:hypothetical protein